MCSTAPISSSSVSHQQSHSITYLHSTTPISSSSSKYLCSTICCGDTFSSFGESFLANSEALPEPTGAADDRK